MKLKRHSLATIIATTGLTLSAGLTTAASVQIDLQSSGTNDNDAVTQSGWNAWELSESFSSTTQSNSFAYTDTIGGLLGVGLTPASGAGARNYGLDFVSDPGNLTVPNVWFDQYFFNNNAGGSLTITLSNLNAGIYQFTSYHYADNLNGDVAGTDDEGTANVSVDTGGGAIDTGSDVHFVTGNVSQVATAGAGVLASEMDAFGTFTTSFTVANDGDAINIIYAPTGLESGDSFGINGFGITQIPEPSAALLIGLGGFLVLRRRQR